MILKMIAAAAGLLVVGGGTTLLISKPLSSGDRNGLPVGALHTVRRGDLKVTITENGSLMAKNSEKITARIKRGGKITFLVEEGKEVEENEVLCKLDVTELERQVQELGLEIVKTEADLKTAETELDIQKSENVATIEKARIALAKAENELERYRDGDAPKERRNFEVAIKKARTDFNRAKKKYEDSRKLLDQEYIIRSEFERDEIEFEQSEIQLESAERDLEIFDQYTFPMTITEKTAGLTDADRALSNAEKRAESTLRQKEVAVESQQTRLDQLQKQLEETNKEIEHSTISAPSPGIVIYGDPTQPWYRGDIKLGGQVWGGFTLFTIPDLRVMQVQVQVHEADISKVANDQPATITMDTYPGLVLQGKVSKVATLAGGGDPWNRRSNDEVKEFTVDITLDSTEGNQLKPGISAKASIFIEEKAGVLFVPLQSVFQEEGNHFAWVMGADAAPARVAVEPGTSNDHYLEVRSGLDEGDRVLLYNPNLEPAGETEDTESAPAPAPAASTAQDGS